MKKKTLPAPKKTPKVKSKPTPKTTPSKKSSLKKILFRDLQAKLIRFNYMNPKLKSVLHGLGALLVIYIPLAMHLFPNAVWDMSLSAALIGLGHYWTN